MSVNVGGQLSGTSGPQQQTYNAPDPTTGFGSVSVYNNSQSVVQVYFSGTALGSPDIQVQALSAVTYPVPGINSITVKFATFPTTGSAQVTCVDAVLSSSSSIIAGTVGNPGIPPAASQIINSYFGGISEAIPTGSIGSGLIAFAPEAIYIYWLDFQLSFYNANSTAALVTLQLTDVNVSILSQFVFYVPPGYSYYASEKGGADLPVIVSRPNYSLGYPAQMSYDLVSTLSTGVSVSYAFNATWAAF